MAQGVLPQWQASATEPVNPKAAAKTAPARAETLRIIVEVLFWCGIEKREAGKEHGG
jgi:hypothetical protein